MTALICSRDVHRQRQVAHEVEGMGHDTILVSSANVELHDQHKRDISAVWMDGRERAYWLRFYERECSEIRSIVITF